MIGGGLKRSRTTGRRVGAAAVCAAVAAVVFAGLAWSQPPPDPGPPPLPGLDQEPDPSAPPPALSLSPTSGPPGTTFIATADPPPICRGLYFDAGTAQRIGVTMDTATFVAPTDPTITSVDVSVRCFGGAAAHRTFTIKHPPAELDLIFSPAEGQPGSQATATLQGCAEGVVLRWGNEAIEVSSNGGFTVPTGDPGNVTVTATCASGGYDTADFTVLPAAPPTLELDRSRGSPGSTFRATGHDFACAEGDVELRWDGGYLATTDSGLFDEALKVPGGAHAGQYTVRAACVDDPDIFDEAQFTVEADVVTGPPPAAVMLSLEPNRGTPGDVVTVIGSGFLCDNNSRPIQPDFGGQMIPSVSPDAAGGFQTSFTVPQYATGTVTLRASCADGSVARTASFTVTAGPVIPTTTTPPTTDPLPKNGVMLPFILLVFAAFAIVAVMVYRGLRKARPPIPNARVRVEQRLGDPPDPVLRETPGQSSHAIRVSVHPGSATHTIERGER